MTLPDVRTMVVRQLSTQKEVQELRDFDPTYMGGPISAVGCMARVIATIQRDLDEWEQEMRDYHEAKRAYRESRTAWMREIWWPWKSQDGADSPEPVCPFLKPGDPPVKPRHVVVISGSTAKLGMEWEPVYTMRPTIFFPNHKPRLSHDQDGILQESAHCPQCRLPLIRNVKVLARYATMFAGYDKGGKQTRSSEEDEDEETSGGTNGFGVLSQEALEERHPDKRRKYRCLHCGSPLWQHKGNLLNASANLPLPDRTSELPLVLSTAKRSYALATYIRKKAKFFFKLLVTDEVHEGAHGTALGFARQELMESCDRSLALTGTLSKGKASDILELLYHLNPQVRHDFPYNAIEQWVDLYGVRQKTRKTNKKEEGGYGSASKQRPSRTIVEEKPGFAPQGLQYVLRMCGFLEIADVASLPPYKEDVRQVELSPELRQAYAAFEREITADLHQMLRNGDKSGLGPWYQALMCYPNMPYRGWTCAVKKSGHIMGIAEAVSEEDLTNKERAIIDYVQEKFQAGRRVLLYTQYTGTLDTMPRWKHILETYVKGPRPLKVKLLYSDTVKPIDRERWLREQVQNDIDVLICNPKLVQVGLDLIDFPSIAYESIPSSTPDFRQSAKRAHRPGQTVSCDTTVFVYPTMESRLFRRMADKMKVSLMIEGSLPGEGLVTYGNEDDDDGSFMMALARDILADMEAGIADQKLEEGAESLQSVYEEIAELAREQQQYVGQEEETSPIEFEPITVKTLPPLEPLPSPMPQSVENRETEKATSSEKRAKVATSPTTKAPQANREVTIVTIPTSQLLDPWAPYRAQVQELMGGKKIRTPKKKKGGMDENIHQSLWASQEEVKTPLKEVIPLKKKEYEKEVVKDLWSSLDEAA